MTAAVAGLLLAAGAGRRMGRPKALLEGADGRSYTTRGITVLREAGCGPVVVVLGAQAHLAEPAAREADLVVVAPDWEAGQSASLRAGLDALSAQTGAAASNAELQAVVVLLVDLLDVDARVVRRVVDTAARTAGELRTALARAAYDGVPGHPVLLGRDHWPGVSASASGDRGARDYLAGHAHEVVECGDLATGRDADSPGDLPR